MRFGQADAGEVGEGGFDGDAAEVVDDRLARERDSRDVDEWHFALAAKVAKQSRFAAAGGAGDEDDPPGTWRGPMRDWEDWKLR